MAQQTDRILLHAGNKIAINSLRIKGYQLTHDYNPDL